MEIRVNVNSLHLTGKVDVCIHQEVTLKSQIPPVSVFALVILIGFNIALVLLMRGCAICISGRE